MVSERDRTSGGASMHQQWYSSYAMPRTHSRDRIQQPARSNPMAIPNQNRLERSRREIMFGDCMGVSFFRFYCQACALGADGKESEKLEERGKAGFKTTALPKRHRGIERETRDRSF